MTQPPSTIGPIVRFRGVEGDSIHLAVTTGGTGEPPAVAFDGEALQAEPIGKLCDTRFWSHPVTLALTDAPQRFDYTVGGHAYYVHVPPCDAALHLAYASCNGGEDEEKAAAWETGRNAMWSELLARHETDPFHLLVMGGDQIYADALWQTERLGPWRRSARKTRAAAPFTAEMAADAEAFYLARYSEVWRQPEIAEALASVPSLMMWDDHDIFDGYGSHPEDFQSSPVVRGLFAIARRAFAAFQLGVDPDSLPMGFADRAGGHFGWAGTYGPASLVVPDLRSERTRRRVLGEAGEAFLNEAVAAADRPRLLVVSSVPIVNADLSPVEKAVRPLMPRIDLYQDDLRDQWMSHAHRTQWHRVVDCLLARAERGTAVTVLSGEIHLATRGTATRGAASFDQFIASGIAHPPPPRALGYVLDLFARRSWRRRDVRLAMQAFDADWPLYVAERNWLEVTVEPGGGLEAVLHAEKSGLGRVVRSATVPR